MMKPHSPMTIRLASCLTIIVLAFVDQWSKWHVIERYFRPLSFDAHGAGIDFLSWLSTMPQDRFPFYRSDITSFFSLVMVWNQGVSFGMFAGTHDAMPYALMIMALAMTAFFALWLARAKTLASALPIAFIISGALSNIWDRARFGAVVDFLDFHWRDFHYPAFNIADSCIVIGVAGLTVYTLFFEKKNRDRQSSTVPSDQI